VASTNESFIDEVAEAVRRDRLNRWFRRWGWIIAVVVLAIVGTAAVLEWRQARQEAAAQARGEAILSALETENAEERLAALSELPVAGGGDIVASFLLAAEQVQAGEAEAAATTLDAVALDAAAPPLYRDLAALKALMVRGDEADPAALEALGAPGAPLRLLAQERLALLDLQAGREEEAVAALQAILEDAETVPNQAARLGALLTALGRPPEAPAAPEAEVPAPVGE
jgi:hypothetical protein